jgi:hypothetical protein
MNHRAPSLSALALPAVASRGYLPAHRPPNPDLCAITSPEPGQVLVANDKLAQRDFGDARMPSRVGPSDVAELSYEQCQRRLDGARARLDAGPEHTQ